MITVDTHMVGLLGKPLKFSFSQVMQNAMFRQKNLDYYYYPIETESEHLKEVVNGMRYMNFAGFNVTKPYKEVIMPFLDEIDELARLIQAVNTVKNENGKLIGYNTDGEGYVASLMRECGFDAKGKRVVLLGAGGAGRAIAMTLAKMGIAQLTITDLYPESAARLEADVNAAFKGKAESKLWESDALANAIQNASLLINATGVGMRPNIEQSPLKPELLHTGLLVSDLTYNPERTRLLKDAEAIGCQVHNGLGMLIHQGAKAFDIWTGCEADVDLMGAVVEKSISYHGGL